MSNTIIHCLGQRAIPSEKNRRVPPGPLFVETGDKIQAKCNFPLDRQGNAGVCFPQEPKRERSNCRDEGTQGAAKSGTAAAGVAANGLLRARAKGGSRVVRDGIRTRYHGGAYVGTRKTSPPSCGEVEWHSDEFASTGVFSGWVFFIAGRGFPTKQGAGSGTRQERIRLTGTAGSSMILKGDT